MNKKKLLEEANELGINIPFLKNICKRELQRIIVAQHHVNYFNRFYKVGDVVKLLNVAYDETSMIEAVVTHPAQNFNGNPCAYFNLGKKSVSHMFLSNQLDF